jgi:DNA-binding transcriptional ArsR family regulator
MAYSKAEQFAVPDDINHIVSMYGKALSYPARVLIMRWLAAEGPKSAGEITAYVCLSKSTTSQHLSRLERAGIITGVEQGSSIIYAFSAENFIIMKGYLYDLFSEVERASIISKEKL